MRTVFMGTPEFAVPCLERLHQLTEVVAVYTQPDRPQGRGLLLAPPAVKVKAMESGLPVKQPEKLRQQSSLVELGQLAPDLIVVVAYAQLLPSSLLALPVYGCINVHASLLPAYRGGAPIHWAVYHGEAITGVSTMLMSRGLDEGDILLQSQTEIGRLETTGQLHDRLAVMGAELLAETLTALQAGQLEPWPQPAIGVSYARNIQKRDGLIDWTRSAQQIHNQVRGLNPWPAAYTWHDGRQLRIWSSDWQSELPSGVPGEVLQISDAGLLVATGSGALLIGELQPANKRRMDAVDYVRGNALKVGTRLGVVEGSGASQV